ncbi:hypothetical protein [Desulfovibrio sp. JC022]|uniref:hypothetical protein n=1 Tax=Desulfovibrio sp. JC022 TaxID=2593642 RepID=UPI0013CFEE67|nr:hypothetical protein [Desulfovibrio sp. JC022]NDV23198.1 hypothetical protein [Desulfovibrio sp. JC022]
MVCLQSQLCKKIPDIPFELTTHTFISPPNAYKKDKPFHLPAFEPWAVLALHLVRIFHFFQFSGDLMPS